jgi:hypothetical protein
LIFEKKKNWTKKKFDKKKKLTKKKIDGKKKFDKKKNLTNKKFDKKVFVFVFLYFCILIFGKKKN